MKTSSSVERESAYKYLECPDYQIPLVGQTTHFECADVPARNSSLHTAPGTLIPSRIRGRKQISGDTCKQHPLQLFAFYVCLRAVFTQCMLPYEIFCWDNAILEVVAACDVMLAPWGWGAGITSFEALAVGLPVITAPSKESVLHFSRGQVCGGCSLLLA